jgi:hypothetical protein
MTKMYLKLLLHSRRRKRRTHLKKRRRLRFQLLKWLPVSGA